MALDWHQWSLQYPSGEGVSGCFLRGAASILKATGLGTGLELKQWRKPSPCTVGSAMKALSSLPPNQPSSPDRRAVVCATAAAGGATVVAAAIPLVASLAPSERARSLGASLEIDIADLAPGAMKTVEWRGKPVWILARSPDMLASLDVHAGTLADPRSIRNQQPAYARNAHRSIRPEVLVVIGICTHLGCSPTVVPEGRGLAALGDDWNGGFFCPCHGSTFDLAGRVFKNKPAPTNLEVPPHRFLSATRLLIGEDDIA